MAWTWAEVFWIAYLLLGTLTLRNQVAEEVKQESQKVQKVPLQIRSSIEAAKRKLQLEETRLVAISAQLTQETLALDRLTAEETALLEHHPALLGPMSPKIMVQLPPKVLEKQRQLKIQQKTVSEFTILLESQFETAKKKIVVLNRQLELRQKMADQKAQELAQELRQDISKKIVDSAVPKIFLLWFGTLLFLLLASYFFEISVRPLKTLATACALGLPVAVYAWLGGVQGTIWILTFVGLILASLTVDLPPTKQPNPESLRP